MGKAKRFKWVIEFEVDAVWVADGFDPDDDQAKEILANTLAYACGSELGARVIKRPSNASIAKAQGYSSVKAYRAANWKGKERI